MNEAATTEIGPMTADEALKRYPRLAAHMICESLGYLSPRAAAVALANHRNGRETGSEMFCHLKRPEESLLDTGRRFIGEAFRRRGFHLGPMAHYPAAARVVEMEQQGMPTIFSSWQ